MCLAVMIVCLSLVGFSLLQHMFLPLYGPDKTACNLSDIRQEDTTVKQKVQGELWRANSAGVHMLHHPPGLVPDQPVGTLFK